MNGTVIEQVNHEIGKNFNELLSKSFGSFLDQSELDLLVKYSQISSHTSGETLLNEREKTTGIYMVLDGIILETVRIMGQGVTNLETLQSGCFLNTICFLECGPCSTSYIATNNALCLIIPVNYFEMLSINYPETKYKLFRVIAKQICTRLKTRHDLVASFISKSDMTSLSFFERVIYSLNQPRKILLEESTIDPRLIQNIRILKSFTNDEIDTLFKHFEMLDAPKNCKLITEGESNGACYLIICGAIQSCIIQDSKLAKLSVIGPGTILAGIGCIENTSLFNVSYITCEHTILYELSESAIKQIKTEHPQLWYKLFNLICGSLAALEKSVDKLNIRLHTETYNR